MSESPGAIEARLRTLIDRGVTIVDVRQTYVGPDVALERIAPGARLHPGTRLHGSRTSLAPGAEIGREGPTTLIDTVLGSRAKIASGFAERAVLLEDASAGANAHLRDGTLLEEQANTAHAVGLKHTILFPFVTLGSVINFCDCLMAGGTSRKDHSEVGSGLIHFNYTPWGKHGDKATPSRFGDVPHGVFLRQPRIFLGGSSGVVGPRHVGFGSVVAAGQVLRRDVGEGRVVASAGAELDRDRTDPAPSVGKVRRNVTYVAHLVALGAFYDAVRLVREAVDGSERAALLAARENIDTAITERKKRLDAALTEFERPPITWPSPSTDGCPLDVSDTASSHIDWVRQLGESECEAGAAWLSEVVSRFVDTALGPPGA
ncbi:MAG: UDP-N-acetylglucosamine pyrophosphorylase [Myxococcales bacterium FL481]|nr:MAG: UDP-N-acetylglucosamine pyrophosphorylase [Myxococcales bacterium FL481]